MSGYRTILLAVALTTGLSGHATLAQDGEIEQWASDALAASANAFHPLAQVSPSAVQSEPEGLCSPFEFDKDDGTVELLDFANHAWRTFQPDRGLEFIEVSFDRPVRATAVEIYQTLNPGALVAVQLRTPDGILHEVWANPGGNGADNCPAVFRIDVDLDFPTNRLRIELDTRLVAGFNQIDAIKLIGFPVDDVELLFDIASWPGETLGSVGCCASPVDYDNDGWPDPTGRPVAPADRETGLRRLVGPVAFAHNEHGRRFAPRIALTATIDTVLTIPQGGQNFGDFDNDGDADLLLPVVDRQAFDRALSTDPPGPVVASASRPAVLLRNDRGAGFVEMTSTGLPPTFPAQAIWLDYDLDGFLDLFVGDWAPPFVPEAGSLTNHLFRNRGDGSFEETTVLAGLDVEWHRPGSSFTGGTFSGALAADFDGNGWPDLFLPIPGSPNRLFLNEQGVFRDATSSEIGIDGGPLVAAAGDVDNDGDLDLLVPSAAATFQQASEVNVAEAAALFLNLGAARFVNVTESAGLGSLIGTETMFAGFFDADNDGDLDLFFGGGTPSYFENQDGTGTFIERPFQAGAVGSSVIADFDGDGFLDMGSAGAYNTGNSNHWIAIDLVGTESNRDGTHARAYATTGDLTQMRELINANGNTQDDLRIHFGLGQATTVDRLEVRWPSGTVDVMSALPADQEIRIIEGQGRWIPAPRTVWVNEPPDDVAFGQDLAIDVVVRPSMFEPEATIASITGDLSSLGGDSAVPLVDQGDGTWRLQSEFVVGGQSDLRDIEIAIEQATSLGPYWINLSRNINVVGEPITAVTERHTDATPSDLALHPNFPNPFNPETVIPFDLPTYAHVELAVYNVGGQRVATLIDGERAPGSYQAVWDGRNDAGVALASGLYFYRLTAGDAIHTRKLLLLR